MQGFRVTDSGVEITIRAVPSGSRNELRQDDQATLKAVVTQAAEKGKANAALLKLLAKQLGIRKSQVTLLSGETSRRKTVLISQVSVDRLRELIGALPK